MERKEHGGSKTEDWNNIGEVSEGKSLDDVGGGIVEAGFSELLGWSVMVGSEVFSGETNEKTRPETHHNTSISLHWSCRVWFTCGELNLHVIWENESAWVDSGAHEDSGDNKLKSKLLENVSLDESKELSDP